MPRGYEYTNQLNPCEPIRGRDMLAAEYNRRNPDDQITSGNAYQILRRAEAKIKKQLMKDFEDWNA